jgi:hypothetical protein
MLPFDGDQRRKLWLLLALLPRGRRLSMEKTLLAALLPEGSRLPMGKTLLADLRLRLD